MRKIIFSDLDLIFRLNKNEVSSIDKGFYYWLNKNTFVIVISQKKIREEN